MIKNTVLLLIFGLGSLFVRADILPKDTVQIQHPGASDGLIQIKEDGTYVYRTKTSTSNVSGHMYFGYADPLTISYTLPSTGQTYTFDDLYGGASKLLIGYDYEWYPWVSKAGRLGFQLGAGFMYAEGHGILVLTGAQSIEKFYFFTVPVNAGLVYRLQWKEKQLIVPYAAGGGIMLGLAEKREDASDAHFATAFGAYGAGGLMLNIGMLDDETSFNLESEYGIGNLWFVAEFRVIEVPGGSFSFSNQIINAGFSFDY